jgi:hypothetical protein
MATDFSKTRIHEMLDTYAPKGGTEEKNPHGMLVLSAGLAIGMRIALARALGDRLLTPECRELRNLVDAVIEHNMILVCKNDEDLKLYTATANALIADVRDLVRGN